MSSAVMSPLGVETVSVARIRTSLDPPNGSLVALVPAPGFGVFALFRSTSTLQHMTSIDESKVAIVVDGRPSPAPLAVGATTTLSVATVADIDRRSLSFQWSRKDGRPLQCGADPSSCELAALPEDVATEQMEVQCVVAEAMGIVQLAKAVPVVAALPTLGPEPRPSSSPLLSASASLSEVRLGGGIVGGVLFAVVMVALVCVVQRGEREGGWLPKSRRECLFPHVRTCLSTATTMPSSTSWLVVSVVHPVEPPVYCRRKTSSLQWFVAVFSWFQGACGPCCAVQWSTLLDCLWLRAWLQGQGACTSSTLIRGLFERDRPVYGLFSLRCHVPRLRCMCDAPFAFLAASPRVACPCSLNPKWSIRWEDFLNVTYLARGGFGQVFSANWQGVQVCVPSSASL